MKPLLQEIQEILTPNNGIGLVQENQLYQLQPIMPLAELIEMSQDQPEDQQKKIVVFLKSEGTVIFNGVVFLKTKGLNFKGRLQEIITVYRSHLKQIIGDKRALINLYDQLPVEDIINLVEDHVIFCMKKFINVAGKGLAAIRYLPTYHVQYEGRFFKFPGCIIAIHVQEDLALDNPEVISDTETFYEHPFVFRDNAKFGQRICMGSFNNSKDKIQFNKLRFANNVNNFLKQAVQILVSGYSRGVQPANGTLDSPQYTKYLIRK